VDLDRVQHRRLGDGARFRVRDRSGQAGLFFSFGLNQWLQYRGIGRWADYAYGEKTYLVFSLVAKSLLAWQIFAGSLAG
jgi:hypothetical protein